MYYINIQNIFIFKLLLFFIQNLFKILLSLSLFFLLNLTKLNTKDLETVETDEKYVGIRVQIGSEIFVLHEISFFYPNIFFKFLWRYKRKEKKD